MGLRYYKTSKVYVNTQNLGLLAHHTELYNNLKYRNLSSLCKVDLVIVFTIKYWQCRSTCRGYLFTAAG